MPSGDLNPFEAELARVRGLSEALQAVVSRTAYLSGATQHRSDEDGLLEATRRLSEECELAHGLTSDGRLSWLLGMQGAPLMPGYESIRADCGDITSDPSAAMSIATCVGNARHWLQPLLATEQDRLAARSAESGPWTDSDVEEFLSWRGSLFRSIEETRCMILTAVSGTAVSSDALRAAGARIGELAGGWGGRLAGNDTWLRIGQSRFRTGCSPIVAGCVQQAVDDVSPEVRRIAWRVSTGVLRATSDDVRSLATVTGRWQASVDSTRSWARQMDSQGIDWKRTFVGLGLVDTSTLIPTTAGWEADLYQYELSMLRS